MKKYIILIVFIISLSFSATSQSSYYYYNGEKIPIDIEDGKITVLTTNVSECSVAEVKGGILLRIGSDSKCKVEVYETGDELRRLQLVSENSSPWTIMQPCYTNSMGKEMIPNGYLNVKLKSVDDIVKLKGLSNQWGFEIVEQNTFMPLWYNIRQNKNIGLSSVELANMIYETGDFEAASPSFSMDCLEISYDPQVFEQWGLYNSEHAGIDMSISKAWSYATGKGVVIAIIDDGVEKTHKDLKDNIYHLSYNAEDNSIPSILCAGFHGTQCAGIIGAMRNNGLMSSGVSPDAKLMVISVDLSQEGPDVTIPLININSEKKFANGINWAWQNGADIISCSWGIEYDQFVKDAIDNAYVYGRGGKGAVVVSSAGNENSLAEFLAENITFPASYSKVIAVGNIKKNGVIHENSSRGENLFICAPGTEIIRTARSNKTISDGFGTSLSCPHVAGVIALMLERNPNLSIEQIREIIANNAKKIGRLKIDVEKEYGSWNQIYGYGLIDAYRTIINTPTSN